MTETPPLRTVAMVGASGLVGRHALRFLLDHDDVARVVALGRRSLEEAHPRLTSVVADLQRESSVAEALPERVDVALCCLGTTIRKAGSQSAFRAVDHDAVLAFARAARGRGAERFVLVSSLGADPESRTFYLRTKGEVEAALGGLGYANVTVLRPSLLDDRGARSEFRLGERLALPLARLVFGVIGRTRRYAPIPAETVARAMVRSAFDRTSEALRVLESEELHAVGAPLHGPSRHGSARMLLACLVLGSWAVASPLAAQSLRVAGGFGPVIPVSGFEEGRNGAGTPVAGSHSLRMEWGWPVAGSRPGIYEAGLGMLSIDFPATEELGRPVTLYGFTHLPLGDLAGAALRFDAALGVSLGWREFDPADNPLQTAIGSPVAAFFQVEMAAVRSVAAELDLVFAVGYRHFSTGNLSLPNRGINTLPVTVGFRARPRGFGPVVLRSPGAAASPPGPNGAERALVGTSPSPWSLHLQPFLGVRTFAADVGHADQDARYVTQRMPVAGAHLRADHALNATLTVAALLNMTWDAGAFRGPEVPSLEVAPLEGRAAFAFGGGVSVLVDTGPAWLEAGVGYAAFDVGARRGVSRFHQRLGVHVQVAEQVRPFVVLRALSFDRPDFIEWGVALRVR